MRKIMKAAHFILNTDYATSQNDATIDLSVAIPSSFYVPGGTLKEFKTSGTLVGSASKNYRVYITSNVYNYAITGVVDGYLKYGNDELSLSIIRSKDTFTFSVWAPKDVSAHTYSGSGQVLTAHIQTFVDPFEV